MTMDDEHSMTDSQSEAASHPNRLHELTGFQRDLCYVIAGLNNPHGLAVMAELEDYYAGPIHHGRLYPNLDALVDAGFVAKRAKDQRTNAYSLTPAGRRALERRRDWEDDYLER